jgi:hypothetical protein
MTKSATKSANKKSWHPSHPPTIFRSFFSKNAKHLALSARRVPKCAICWGVMGWVAERDYSLRPIFRDRDDFTASATGECWNSKTVVRTVGSNPTLSVQNRRNSTCLGRISCTYTST